MTINNQCCLQVVKEGQDLGEPPAGPSRFFRPSVGRLTQAVPRSSWTPGSGTTPSVGCSAGGPEPFSRSCLSASSRLCSTQHYYRGYSLKGRDVLTFQNKDFIILSFQLKFIKIKCGTCSERRTAALLFSEQFNQFSSTGDKVHMLQASQKTLHAASRWGGDMVLSCAVYILDDSSSLPLFWPAIRRL